MRISELTYYFVNSVGISSNDVYKYDGNTRQMIKVLTLKDHRLLNSVNYLDPSNYLLSIG